MTTTSQYFSFFVTDETFCHIYLGERYRHKRIPQVFDTTRLIICVCFIQLKSLICSGNVNCKMSRTSLHGRHPLVSCVSRFRFICIEMVAKCRNVKGWDLIIHHSHSDFFGHRFKPHPVTSSHVRLSWQRMRCLNVSHLTPHV